MDFKNEKNITIFEHPLIQHKICLLYTSDAADE